MSQLTEDGAAIRQAIMYMDVERSELRIIGAIGGRAAPGTGCAFHTLLGANAAFHEVAKTTPLSDPRLIAYRTQEIAQEVGRKLALEQAMLQREKQEDLHKEEAVQELSQHMNYLLSGRIMADLSKA